MANPWFRLWGDMVNDPKWRTIARVSKQEISRVLSVYLHMMTLASSATERGHTEGWNDEDIATALDMDTEEVTTIRNAMQGRVLDGDYLTGWEKRQPKRERDEATTSTARVQEFRAKQNHETPCNANDNHETPRLDKEEIRQEKSKASAAPKSDYTPEFEIAWNLYPSRPGANKKAAFKAWNARLKAGVDFVEMTFGAERYGYYVLAMKTEPQFIKQPETFFGPDEHYKADWTVPEQRQPTIAWHATDAGVEAKALEMDPPLRPYPGESRITFKARVIAAIDNGGKPPAQMPTRIASAAEPVRVEVSPEVAAQRSADLKAVLKPRAA